MKKIYSLMLALSCVISASAADVTPAKFKFSAMQEGACPAYFTNFYKGAGPNYVTDAATIFVPEGAAVMAGGQIDAAGTGGVATKLKSALSIVKDGGENVLSIQGAQYSDAAATGGIVGFVNPHFIMPNTQTDGIYQVAFSLKANNTYSPVAEDPIKIFFKNKSGALIDYTVVSGGEKPASLGSGATPFKFNDNKYVTFVVNMDLKGAPLVIYLSIPGYNKIDKSAILIKDILITKDEATTIGAADAAATAIATTQDGIVVTAEADEMISVYTMTGIEVANVQAQKGENAIQLNKGIYLVKVGDKVTKIAL